MFPYHQLLPLNKNHSKRPRRKYNEIERLYVCNWHGCSKAYGTLNHLNAHVAAQGHGSKRAPSEFKELRRMWKEQKKAKLIEQQYGHVPQLQGSSAVVQGPSQTGPPAPGNGYYPYGYQNGQQTTPVTQPQSYYPQRLAPIQGHYTYDKKDGEAMVPTSTSPNFANSGVGQVMATVNNTAVVSGLTTPVTPSNSTTVAATGSAQPGYNYYMDQSQSAQQNQYMKYYPKPTSSYQYGATSQYARAGTDMGGYQE
ncbi:C2H2 finger domain transcription factor CON7 [Yarrowia sp. B02]|nr:C2H2 finger domain transcription factor CON7 [Yarrowia sp. B02]